MGVLEERTIEHRALGWDRDNDILIETAHLFSLHIRSNLGSGLIHSDSMSYKPFSVLGFPQSIVLGRQTPPLLLGIQLLVNLR